MKLIIAGSRNHWVPKAFLDEFFMWRNLTPEEIVSGGARGIDRDGEDYANDRSIKLTIFDADWDTHGKAAGPIRNKQMAEYADALLLIWDGSSPGSKSMQTEMFRLNKPVYEVIVE